MKNIVDVLRMKEQEILRLKREIDALRIAARLLSEHESSPPSETRVETRHRLQMP